MIHTYFVAIAENPGTLSLAYCARNARIVLCPKCILFLKFKFPLYKCSTLRGNRVNRTVAVLNRCTLAGALARSQTNSKWIGLRKQFVFLIHSVSHFLIAEQCVYGCGVSDFRQWVRVLKSIKVVIKVAVPVPTFHGANAHWQCPRVAGRRERKGRESVELSMMHSALMRQTMWRKDRLCPFLLSVAHRQQVLRATKSLLRAGQACHSVTLEHAIRLCSLHASCMEMFK